MFLERITLRYQLNTAEFFVGAVDYLGPVLAEDNCRSQVSRYENRNTIKRVF
jgi:hypothetical protein